MHVYLFDFAKLETVSKPKYEICRDMDWQFLLDINSK